MHVIMSYLLTLYSYCCRLTTYMTSSLSLRGILDANKFTGPNYVDWLRNLRIILTQEKVFYILDTPAPDTIGEDVTEEEMTTYKIWQDDSVTIKCVMLVRNNTKAWMFLPYFLI